VIVLCTDLSLRAVKNKQMHEVPPHNVSLRADTWFFATLGLEQGVSGRKEQMNCCLASSLAASVPGEDIQ
jgi:hypothetical protein